MENSGWPVHFAQPVGALCELLAEAFHEPHLFRPVGDGVIAAEAELGAAFQFFLFDQSLFVELHGRRDGDTGAYGVEAVFVAEIVGLDDGLETFDTAADAEGEDGLVFRAFALAVADLRDPAAADGAAEAGVSLGEEVLWRGFRRTGVSLGEVGSLPVVLVGSRRAGLMMFTRTAVP